jgi:signal transduction histidine kinase
MTTVTAPVTDHARRVEELGRIIMAYSQVTEKLQKSHDQLMATVQSLRKELSEKDRQLERRNRLAALGEMAAGMAHEIRNPLGGIQLYSSILAGDLCDQPQSLAVVKKISGGVQRLEALVSQVLQFTRDITANVVQMNLDEVIAESIELASGQLSARNIDCQVDGPRPMPVIADPLLIGQAILNLVLNAAEASTGGGSGRIFVQYTAVAGQADGDARQFHLSVRDSGTGIAPQILDRIFNPFFTTKETGTGLGLAIVHRIVEAHDGTIIAANAEDGGAKFEIRI